MRPVEWSPSSEYVCTSVADRVYGYIELPRPIRDIIDTPQFQRLRRIKQLGMTYLVYPGGDYSRFEHSIGVCHLAGQLMRSLQSTQKELNITDNDVLVVMIAALCHDLGHGPFSHFFDMQIVPRLTPKDVKPHEKLSIAMFEHLLQQNPSVKAQLDKHLTDQDYIFIKEAISPDFEKRCKAAVWTFVGRSEDKSFMYDVVSNKNDGADVDRYDYMLRDRKTTGVSTNLNKTSVERLINHTRVFPVGEHHRNALCFAEKVTSDLSNLYSSRYQLHCTVYQHKTVKAFEAVFVDIFMAASECLKFVDAFGVEHLMHECIDLERMDLYEQLDDSLVERVRCSRDARLEQARCMLHRIDTRHTYKLMGELNADAKIQLDELTKRLLTQVDGLEAKSLHITQSTIHHGSQEANPLLQVHVFQHKSPMNVQPYKLTQPLVKFFNLSSTMKKFMVHVFYSDPYKLSADAIDKFEQVLVDYGNEKHIPLHKSRRQSGNAHKQQPPPPMKKAKSVPPSDPGSVAKRIETFV